MGLGSREIGEMKEAAGLTDGWVCSQATLALQTQSQTACREPIRKHQDIGERGRGELATTVGGRLPRQKKERKNADMKGCTEMEYRTEQNQNALSFQTIHQFLFFPLTFLPGTPMAWEACFKWRKSLQSVTSASSKPRLGLQCLWLKWRLSPRWD